MNDNEEVHIGQTETSPEPAINPSKVKNEQRKPSFLQKTLRQVGFALLFMLIGALTVGLALYLPARSSLQMANQELDRLVPIEEEHNALLELYETANIESQVYKLLSNGILLQTAFDENETSRIRQLVGYMEDDLEEMNIAGHPEIPVSLADQFNDVATHASSNPSKASTELEKFIEDLRLLLDNIE